jgi:cytochrome P450
MAAKAEVVGPAGVICRDGPQLACPMTTETILTTLCGVRYLRDRRRSGGADLMADSTHFLRPARMIRGDWLHLARTVAGQAVFTARQRVGDSRDRPKVRDRMAGKANLISLEGMIGWEGL